MKTLLRVLLVVCLVIYPSEGRRKKAKRSSAPLFPQDHPNITFMTDQNFDTVLHAHPGPWLIDMYHPYCPHCRAFVPDWIKIAAYYKVEGSVKIGAISCFRSLVCTRYKVDDFPSLVTFHFKVRNGYPTERLISTHSVADVIKFVDSLRAKYKIGPVKPVPVKATIAPVKATPPPKKEIKIWEESTLPSDQTTRIQDAASAFIFGVKHAAFTGRAALNEAQLDALKEWIRVVSLTFPGAMNRQVISRLYDKTKTIPYLESGAWDAIVSSWQESAIQVYESRNFTEKQLSELKEWEKMWDIFNVDGEDFVACASYTCGQWNLFHLMTVNPAGGTAPANDTLVAVISASRRFVQHFFGCVECRNHFLQANPLSKVKEIQQATDKRRFLKLWLWNMHNSVNKRIGHYQWPKPAICPSCGTAEGGWKENEIIKWLEEWYGYEDTEVSTFAPAAKPHILRHPPPDSIPDIDQVPKIAKAPVRMHHAGEGIPAGAIYIWYIIPIVALGVYYAFMRPSVRRGKRRQP